MSTSDTRDPLPNADEPSERFHDHLKDDDAAGEPDSPDAVLDADTIGSALRDGDDA